MDRAVEEDRRSEAPPEIALTLVLVLFSAAQPGHQAGNRQAREVKNLSVVDGSSFVSGGAQNPTLTMVALTLRATDYLAEEMRKGNL
ncbi:MAG: hypothetical protein HY236_04665 [Acidobacteria bacterium]|nr:hypothetical protein [Acidobacteriota bacterium]